MIKNSYIYALQSLSVLSFAIYQYNKLLQYEKRLSKGFFYILALKWKINEICFHRGFLHSNILRIFSAPNAISQEWANQFFWVFWHKFIFLIILWLCQKRFNIFRKKMIIFGGLRGDKSIFVLFFNISVGNQWKISKIP